MRVRPAGPRDYDRVISVLDDWWDGRQMHNMLPRLFFVHFQETCFVAQEGSQLMGFLAGFLSQTYPDEAYIHFAGVHPERRRETVGRRLYLHFFDVAAAHGRSIVRCVTSPVNTGSLAFHQALGFNSELVPGYDGPGAARWAFVKRLDLSASGPGAA
jgi:ribosomal protein S18 acetylase RimI-like enzyme